MAQIYEYQDIDAHVILLFVHPAYFSLSAQKKFVTKFVICITKFLTCVTNFVTSVTNFVIKIVI